MECNMSLIELYEEISRSVYLLQDIEALWAKSMPVAVEWLVPDRVLILDYLEESDTSLTGLVRRIGDTRSPDYSMVTHCEWELLLVDDSADLARPLCKIRRTGLQELARDLLTLVDTFIKDGTFEGGVD